MIEYHVQLKVFKFQLLTSTVYFSMTNRMTRILASLIGLHLAGCVRGTGYAMCPCVTPPNLTIDELSAATRWVFVPKILII